MPVASFAADVHVSLVPGSQIQTESSSGCFVKSAEDAGFYFEASALRSCFGSNGSNSTYFSSPIVIQNYCPRIKDRFGKNLPGLI